TDRLADAVAVLRPPLQGPEDEHVERALEQLEALVGGLFGHSRRQSTATDVERLRLVPSARAGSPEGLRYVPERAGSPEGLRYEILRRRGQCSAGLQACRQRLGRSAGLQACRQGWDVAQALR